MHFILVDPIAMEGNVLFLCCIYVECFNHKHVRQFWIGTIDRLLVNQQNIYQI